MALIGVLNTLVQADTGAFEKGMGKAAASLQTFQQANAQVGQNISQAWGNIKSLTGIGGIIGGLVGPWLGYSNQVGAILGGVTGAAVGAFRGLRSGSADAAGGVAGSAGVAAGALRGLAGDAQQSVGGVRGALASLAQSTGPVGGLFFGMADRALAALGSLSQGLGPVGSAASGLADLFGTALAGAVGVFAGAAVAGVAAVGGLGVALHAMASKGAAAIDELRLFARQIGITTELMASFGAAHGIDQSTFTRGVMHMQRSIADGSREAGAALSRMGLSLQELKDKSPDQQLAAIYGAFNSITDQSERANAAMSLFSRGGIGLMDSLAGGAAGLDSMRARAQRFGLEFSESQANAVRRANSEWGNLGKAFTGIGRQAAIVFAPFWEAAGKVGGQFGEVMVGMFRVARPMMQEVIGWVAGRFTALLEIVKPVGEWLVETFRMAMPAIREIGGAILEAFKTLFVVNPVIAMAGAAWDDFAGSVGSVDFGGAIRAVIPYVQGFAESMRTAFMVIGDTAREIWGGVYWLAKQALSGVASLFTGQSFTGTFAQAWERVVAIAANFRDTFKSAVPWLLFLREMISNVFGAVYEFSRVVVGVLGDAFRAVGGVIDSVFAGGSLRGWFSGWNVGWANVRDLALDVMASITVLAQRWQETFSVAVDWVHLKFLELGRWLATFYRDNLQFLGTIGRLTGRMTGVSLVTDPIINRVEAAGSPAALAAMEARIAALRGSIARFSGSIGDSARELVDEWRRVLDAAGQSVAESIDRVASRAEQAAAQVRSATPETRHEAPLAGSNAAFTLLWGQQANRDSLARAQLDWTRREAALVNDLLREFRRAPAIRRGVL